MSTPSRTGARRPVRSSLGAEQLHSRPRPRQSLSAGQAPSRETSLAQPALEGDQEVFETTSREQLVLALQQERTARHEGDEYKLLAQKHSHDEHLARLQNQVLDLEAALATAKKREEDALASQLRLETDLIERGTQVEQLRETVNKHERLLQEAERRAAAETRDFEAERQALTERIEDLHRATQAAPPRSPIQVPPSDPGGDEALRAAKEQIAVFVAEQTRNLAQANALRNDLATALARITELEEEAQSWELLMRERTLDGTFLSRGLLEVNAADEERETARRDGGVLDALDESLENDEAQKGMAGQTPRETRRANDEEIVGGGSDLASELERAELYQATGATATGKDDAVQAELKQLRETNKALTLYCSKIIDRIILQEGFEHILSVDYKTRRVGSKTRPSLPQVSSSRHDEAPGNTEPGRESQPRKQEGKARPLSMMSRAFSLSGASPAPDPSAEPPTKTESSASVQGTEDWIQPETKSEKRARRGFSLDFRSFGFGSGSSSPGGSNGAVQGLKPLTLAPQQTAIGAARKLEPHEEDDEDLRERHRLEASLKLMGINRSTGQAVSSDVRSDSSTSGLRDLDRASDTSDIQRRSRRVSRLSSLLGTHTTGLRVEYESAEARSSSHEDQAEQLLQAFDRREKERAEVLARGGNEPGASGSGSYTSPGPAQKRRSAFRRSSAVSSRSAAPSPSKSSVG